MKPSFLLSLAAAVTFASTSFAQMPDGGGPGGPGFGGPDELHGPLADLNLTSAQEAQVKQVMQANRQNLRGAQLAVVKAQKALHEAVDTTPNDQTAISADGAELGAALARSAELHAKLKVQIDAFLSADQKRIEAEKKQEMVNRVDRLIQKLSAES